MNDTLSFDIAKLTELLDELNNNYYEYSSSLAELDKEITNLENIWGITNKSIYNDFKEVYKEKKIKDNLTNKNDQLVTATEKAKNSFE